MGNMWRYLLAGAISAAALLSVCAPPNPESPTPTPAADQTATPVPNNDTTPTPTVTPANSDGASRTARQEAADIDTDLAAMSEETIQTLVAEQGLTLGSTVAGKGDATVLAGNWTGTLQDQASGTEESLAIQFGPSGELAELTIYNDQIVEEVLNFAADATAKREIKSRALGAKVATDDGVNFLVLVAALIDVADDGQLHRFLEVLTIEFALEEGQTQLVGKVNRFRELLGTSQADEELGTTTTTDFDSRNVRNRRPLADAGDDQTVFDTDGDGLETVTLDGSRSSDPDGTVVSYRWTVDDFQIATGARPEVTFSLGSHTLRLTVSDDDGAADADDVLIVVQPVWNATTIESAGEVGKYCSLAVIGGQPAIGYYDSTAGDLKYAQFLQGRWSIAPLDTTGAVGMYPSLAAVNGLPAISYYDDTNDDLKYARFDGRTWQTTVVDADGDVGKHTSLAMIGERVGISYRDVTNRRLKYAELGPTGWDLSIVDTGLGPDGSTSLAEINGQPAIAYWDADNGDLKYAHHDGSAWQIAVVDSAGEVGRYASLAEIDGQPAISYRDSTNGDLKYARFDGTAWQIVTVDEPGNVGSYTSLAAIGGNPAISYYGGTGVKYAWFDGSHWQIVGVDAGAFAGLAHDWTATSLAELNGRAAISYYDETDRDLKFATLDDTADYTNVGP